MQCWQVAVSEESDAQRGSNGYLFMKPNPERQGSRRSDRIPAIGAHDDSVADREDVKAPQIVGGEGHTAASSAVPATPAQATALASSPDV